MFGIRHQRNGLGPVLPHVPLENSSVPGETKWPCQSIFDEAQDIRAKFPLIGTTRFPGMGTT